MKHDDYVYRHTFNVLADLLLYGNVVNSGCHNRDECEKTMEVITAVLEKMKKQIEYMEN